MLEPGFRDGTYVRAKIVIHDVKSALEDNHTRELSLGYSRDLEMTSGVWHGHPYDGIQRNIRINHLAIVEDARAGSAARLNIDSNDIDATEISEEGGNSMRRNDSEAISPEELQKQIDGFVAKNSKADADDVPAEAELKANGETKEAPKPEETAEVPEAKTDEDKPEEVKNGEAGEEPKDPKALTPAEIIEAVRQKQDCKDGNEPEDLKAALDEKDKDIKALLDAIDAMEAVKDLTKGETEQDCKDGDEPVAEEVVPEGEAADCGGKDCKDESENADPTVEVVAEDEDEDEEAGNALTKDAVDRRVNEKIKAIRMGDKLNLDGLEGLSLIEIKKAIIRKYDPKMNFDGKSKSYINTAYDFVVDKLGELKKDTNYQRAQMRGFGMNLDAADAPKVRRTAAQARAEMENNLYSAKNEGGI